MDMLDEVENDTGQNVEEKGIQTSTRKHAIFSKDIGTDKRQTGNTQALASERKTVTKKEEPDNKGGFFGRLLEKLGCSQGTK